MCGTLSMPATTPLYVHAVPLSGPTAVNVWGAMGHDGLGILHRIEGPLTSAKYCNILDYVMIPYDLSPVHTAKVVEELLNMRGVRCLSSADVPSVQQQPVSIGSAAKHHPQSYRLE
ncbi:hypothetical protein MTO96_030004 [Rhipicephalus appendiculatus]